MYSGGTHGSKGTLDFTMRGDNTAYVNREVPEKHQGIGIGTDLLHAAEKLAEEIGVHTVQAQSNRPRAIKSYKRAKWKIVIADKQTGEVLVEKKIRGNNR